VWEEVKDDFAGLFRPGITVTSGHGAAARTSSTHSNKIDVFDLSQLGTALVRSSQVITLH
jgi:hypothetical protein